jgi:hypothetical protein
VRIVVTISPELKALLRNRAAMRGQDISFVASELLAHVLAWGEQASQETVKVMD